MAADAARACELAAPESAWRRFGLVLGGVAAQFAGDRTAAIAQLEEAVADAEGGTPVAAALAHAQLALVAADACAWGDAAQHARDAQVALAVVPGARPVRALALAVYAVAAAQRGDTAQARHDAADARRLLSSHARRAAVARRRDACVAGARRDPAQRRPGRPRTAPPRRPPRRPARRRPGAGALDPRGLGASRTRSPRARPATGRRSRTPSCACCASCASHMSFREIGERLHVSTNTVKTQALSVYRKLDVSSRSEAVTRGRAAGLIDA